MIGEELVNSIISAWKSLTGFESLSATLDRVKENVILEVNKILQKKGEKKAFIG